MTSISVLSKLFKVHTWLHEVSNLETFTSQISSQIKTDRTEHIFLYLLWLVWEIELSVDVS